MKTLSTYTSWDFTNIWFPPGSNYPTLRCILTTPLPVELTTFTVNVIENNVELNWETATEVNNYGFEIERQSSDASTSPALSVDRLSMTVIPSSSPASGVGDEGWKKLHLYKDMETVIHQNIILIQINL